MIKHILLIDIDLRRDAPETGSAYYSHHPIGLMYLASFAGTAFPEIKFSILHTATATDPLHEVKKRITDLQPDLIGLRSLSAARDHFDTLAVEIRNFRPDIPLIGGGPYPSASYRELLQKGLLDLVVIGEGEHTFNELILRLQTSSQIPGDLKGTAVLENGQIKLNAPRPLIPDPDSLPFPDYGLIDLNAYTGIQNHALQEVSSSAFILSSRGCPYQCFYCHQLFGNKIRRRSPAHVVAEMREHIDVRGLHNFVFLDDVFNVPLPECKLLLKSIITHLPKVSLSFPNGLRADRLDEEALDLFEQAGTVEMALAVETAVPRLQQMIGKNLNIARAEEAIQAATRRFITRLFFIVGFPTETFEEALSTVNFAASFKYAAQPMLSVLRIYRDSPFYAMLNPDAKQMAALAEQEMRSLHLEMFHDISFYGDLFPEEKVPLKSDSLKEILFSWMRDVLGDPERVKNSHQVITRHLDPKQTLEFYRGVFGKPAFSERDLEKLLR